MKTSGLARGLAVAVVAFGTGTVASPGQEEAGKTRAQEAAPLTEDERIFHLLARFTPGATPELVNDVRRAGLREWFERQLKGDLPESEEYAALLAPFDTINLGIDKIYENYEERIPKDATPREKREIRRRAAIPLRETLAWILIRALHSSNPVREASCDFFRNHFSVSIDKGQVKVFVVDWEREVIRKRALGSFGDMLEASAKHPAMLFFLDNYLSRRPPTPEELKQVEAQVRRRTGSEERAEEAVDIAKQRGLNENYARELMELHTLGVDHFYTQADVINVAKCLTGWTIRRRGFEFDPKMHCPGDKTVLGETIKGNKSKPVAEGEEVLKRLRSHEGTAQFLSWKLCRWFVNDEPDEAMVQRVAKVFRKTDGDIPSVFRAIVDDPDFFSRKNYQAKYKRPSEFVISALRVTHAEIARFEPIDQVLAVMNEPLYRCSDPTGFYDQAEAWRDPGALATRWTFANDLAAGRINGVKIPASFYKDLPPDKPGEWKNILVRKILPVGGLGEPTGRNLDSLVEIELKKNSKPDPMKVGPVIVTVLLGSPEFQKQ